MCRTWERTKVTEPMKKNRHGAFVRRRMNTATMIGMITIRAKLRLIREKFTGKIIPPPGQSVECSHSPLNFGNWDNPTGLPVQACLSFAR
jgi:hypothetical protein